MGPLWETLRHLFGIHVSVGAGIWDPRAPWAFRGRSVGAPLRLRGRSVGAPIQLLANAPMLRCEISLRRTCSMLWSTAETSGGKYVHIL